jgi:ABC-type amino acid transport substrate-binding protein
MQVHPKAFHGIVFGIIVLWVFLLYPATSSSQNEVKTPRVLQVGVIAASPLYMKTPDGRWEGFAVELWQAVAQQLNVAFEFREFSSLGNLLYCERA